jgi:hypothetical protein
MTHMFFEMLKEGDVGETPGIPDEICGLNITELTYYQEEPEDIVDITYDDGADIYKVHDREYYNVYLYKAPLYYYDPETEEITRGYTDIGIVGVPGIAQIGDSILFHTTPGGQNIGYIMRKGAGFIHAITDPLGARFRGRIGSQDPGVPICKFGYEDDIITENVVCVDAGTWEVVFALADYYTKYISGIPILADDIIELDIELLAELPGVSWFPDGYEVPSTDPSVTWGDWPDCEHPCPGGGERTCPYITLEPQEFTYDGRSKVQVGSTIFVTDQIKFTAGAGTTGWLGGKPQPGYWNQVTPGDITSIFSNGINEVTIEIREQYPSWFGAHGYCAGEVGTFDPPAYDFWQNNQTLDWIGVNYGITIIWFDGYGNEDSWYWSPATSTWAQSSKREWTDDPHPCPANGAKHQQPYFNLGTKTINYPGNGNMYIYTSPIPAVRDHFKVVANNGETGWIGGDPGSNSWYSVTGLPINITSIFATGNNSVSIEVTRLNPIWTQAFGWCAGETPVFDPPYYDYYVPSFYSIGLGGSIDLYCEKPDDYDEEYAP